MARAYPLMSTTLLAMVLAGFLGCCDEGLAPPAATTPLAFDAANGIEVVGQTLVVKGQSFTHRPTVQDLRTSLGVESSLMQPGNTVLIWDELGLLAIVPPVAAEGVQPATLDPKTPVSELTVRYGGQQFTFEPKNSHPHNVRINGVVIGPTTSMAELTSKGYQQDKATSSIDGQSVRSVVQSAPPFDVFVRFTQRGRAVSEVAIGMEGWPVTQSGTQPIGTQPPTIPPANGQPDLPPISPTLP